MCVIQFFFCFIIILLSLVGNAFFFIRNISLTKMWMSFVWRKRREKKNSWTNIEHRHGHMKSNVCFIVYKQTLYAFNDRNEKLASIGWALLCEWFGRYVRTRQHRYTQRERKRDVGEWHAERKEATWKILIVFVFNLFFDHIHEHWSIALRTFNWTQQWPRRLHTYRHKNHTRQNKIKLNKITKINIFTTLRIHTHARHKHHVSYIIDCRKNQITITHRIQAIWWKKEKWERQIEKWDDVETRKKKCVCERARIRTSRHKSQKKKHQMQ